MSGKFDSIYVEAQSAITKQERLLFLQITVIQLNNCGQFSVAEIIKRNGQTV